MVPILLMNITITVKSYLNPDKVPDFFGIKPFVVLTWSMEPYILGGDLVVTKTVDPATLKVNDIISFKEGDTVITHRIVELTEIDGQPAFITKGDMNESTDAKTVGYSQVESIYMFRVAGLGKVAMFMQTPLGILLLVGFPLTGLILYDIIRNRLQRKKEMGAVEAQAEIERLKAELAQKSGMETANMEEPAELGVSA
jgi:signal peptidase